jgi:soluble lytic murein transglycosylase-like protein
MIKDNRNVNPLAYLNDMVVVCMTVAVCTFLLTVASAFTKRSAVMFDTTPVLNLPQPPPPLFLAPEPESTAPVVEEPLIMLAFDTTWRLPAIEVAWALPTVDEFLGLPEIEENPARVETVAAISPVPDGASSNESIPYHGIIVQAAGRYEVDPHLIRAIILAESNYNPKAKSKKGARGLMQLMPSTAKSLGVENIYDPEENINGGVRYFRSLLDRFDGDVQLALAAYNAGSRHVRKYAGIPPFKATQRYIKKVLKFHRKFKMQQSGGSRRLA